MIPAGVRIFVCTEPIDMRYGFDRLAAAARDRVGQDPQHGGALFIFSNKGANRLKILWFESRGCCLLYKRLHRAVFELPLGRATASVSIDAAALAKLIAGAERRTRDARRRASSSHASAHRRLTVVARRDAPQAQSDA